MDGVHDGGRVEEMDPASIILVDQGGKQRPVSDGAWQTRPGQDMAVRPGSPETCNVDHVALAILRSQAGQVRLVRWLWHGKYWNKYRRSFVVQTRYEAERQKSALVTERKVFSGTEGGYHS